MGSQRFIRKPQLDVSHRTAVYTPVQRLLIMHFGVVIRVAIEQIKMYVCITMHACKFKTKKTNRQAIRSFFYLIVFKALSECFSIRLSASKSFPSSNYTCYLLDPTFVTSSSLHVQTPGYNTCRFPSLQILDLRLFTGLKQLSVVVITLMTDLA